jgi:hypothetical protein
MAGALLDSPFSGRRIVTEAGMLNASRSAANSSSVDALNFNLSTAKPTGCTPDTLLASPLPVPVEGADFLLFFAEPLLGPDFLYGTAARGSMSSPVVIPLTSASIVPNMMRSRAASVAGEQVLLLPVVLELESTVSTDRLLPDSPEKAFPLLTLRLSESDICTSKPAFLTELTLLRLGYTT